MQFKMGFNLIKCKQNVEYNTQYKVQNERKKLMEYIS
jgi:transcription initiation factor IIE alpha subunit